MSQDNKSKEEQTKLAIFTLFEEEVIDLALEEFNGNIKHKNFQNCITKNKEEIYDYCVMEHAITEDHRNIFQFKDTLYGTALSVKRNHIIPTLYNKQVNKVKVICSNEIDDICSRHAEYKGYKRDRFKKRVITQDIIETCNGISSDKNISLDVAAWHLKKSVLPTLGI